MPYFHTIAVAPQRDESDRADETRFENCEPEDATEWAVFAIDENGDGELLDSFPLQWKAECFAAGARMELADNIDAATYHLFQTLEWAQAVDGIDYGLAGRKAIADLKRAG